IRDGHVTGVQTCALPILKISGIGFHAVGVFIILSGWALMESTARRAESASLKWGNWYRARSLRLYPMYWVAHLVYLVSPFVARRSEERRVGNEAIAWWAP